MLPEDSLNEIMPHVVIEALNVGSNDPQFSFRSALQRSTDSLQANMGAELRATSKTSKWKYPVGNGTQEL
jgi:hypothetical protein